MTPKVIGTGKGGSFKGLAQYVLHDPNAVTAERVAWCHTEGLATDDPHLAWKIMAATAMDAPRLKHAAGKRVDNRSKKPVFHFTLSWHPDEAEGLSKEEMIRATRGALEALGVSDRQALIVAHDDTDHPHVHVCLNRVSPENGVMWDPRKPAKILSRWASDYERSRENIVSPRREANRIAAEAGLPYLSPKKTAWHVLAREVKIHDAANDNRSKQRVLDDWAARGALLQKARTTLKSQQVAERESLLARVTDMKASNRQILKTARQRARNTLAKTLVPALQELERTQRGERDWFERSEQSLIGKAFNRLKAAHLSDELLGANRQGSVVSSVWNAVSRAQNPREALKSRHTAQTRALKRRHMAAVRPLLREARAALKQAERLRLSTYAAELSMLESRHARQSTQWKTQWRAHEQAAELAVERLRTPSPDPVRDAASDRVTSFRDLMRQRRGHKGNDKDRDR